MNREIKFRGKRLDNDEWVYGDFYRTMSRRGGSHHIIVVEKHDLGLVDDHHKVDAVSVGQFTGLKDENGKEVYESDIVKSGMTGAIYEIRNGEYSTKDSHGIGFWKEGLNGIGDRNILSDNDSIRIIGDIHTTPDLLK